MARPAALTGTPGGWPGSTPMGMASATWAQPLNGWCALYGGARTSIWLIPDRPAKSCSTDADGSRPEPGPPSRFRLRMPVRVVPNLYANCRFRLPGRCEPPRRIAREEGSHETAGTPFDASRCDLGFQPCGSADRAGRARLRPARLRLAPDDDPAFHPERKPSHPGHYLGLRPARPDAGQPFPGELVLHSGL